MPGEYLQLVSIESASSRLDALTDFPVSSRRLQYLVESLYTAQYTDDSFIANLFIWESGHGQNSLSRDQLETLAQVFLAGEDADRVVHELNGQAREATGALLRLHQLGHVPLAVRRYYPSLVPILDEGRPGEPTWLITLLARAVAAETELLQTVNMRRYLSALLGAAITEEDRRARMLAQLHDALPFG